MTPTQKMMKSLEERDYCELDVPDHLLHFVKMRDRLAYYSLQLKPFFYQEPWDLPVVVGDRRYRPADLQTLQGWGMSSVEFFNLLTDIEVAIIEAAGRRGIMLQKRPKVEGDSNAGTPPQRLKQARGSALVE